MNGWWQPAPWSRWHYIVDGRAACHGTTAPGQKPPAYFGGPLTPQPGGPKCTHCASTQALIVNGG